MSTASRNNNILKDITYKRNVDLNTKKCVQVKSSINCNKELLISKSQSVEPCVFISDKSVNGEANEDTNINNTKLKNQNIKSTITTAVTHTKERIAAAIETFCAINQENITYEEVENLEDTGY
ncbi:uncharacterized protein LOC120358278 [Solenopsis invicta]|uniref:uncharacterized protein LOC120358278 n=1 Tax=Solenopsis invicta TaxID=13686 RepID=UPI00193D0E18|nr:uncharacterized protein LOC120358278 [Solenopsis invicta]